MMRTTSAVLVLLASCIGARSLPMSTARNWAELKTHCEAKTGADVTLSDSFDSTSYPGGIQVVGSGCIIRGSGQIFDMRGKGRFATIYNTSLQVHGLTFRNSDSGAQGIQDSFGGALWAPFGATLEIHACSFVSNKAGKRANTGAGGAVAIQNGRLLVKDSSFEANRANTGGAIYAEHQTRVELFNNTFKDNGETFYFGETAEGVFHGGSYSKSMIIRDSKAHPVAFECPDGQSGRAIAMAGDATVWTVLPPPSLVCQ